MYVECRRCPYFGKMKEKLQKGHVIIGFCQLRQRYIADSTINKQLCKDRALIILEKLGESEKKF